ncbi:unnamed protein product [Oncorhynchus mykiss]|uniref:Fibrinogen C-terminal domain-containing protein n=1 Tax=Oncorhynchus mykiss TaxID=8022 RepID=A0A060Z288_ONCMY|nr:unnamed protein product [Oncorhynchus mykiss]
MGGLILWHNLNYLTNSSFDLKNTVVNILHIHSTYSFFFVKFFLVNYTKVSFKGKRTAISTMMFSVMLVLLVPVAVQSSLHPVDCNEVYQSGSGQNGVYTIYPAGSTSPVQVFCEMSMDSAFSGKWTVSIQYFYQYLNTCMYLLVFVQ